MKNTRILPEWGIRVHSRVFWSSQKNRIYYPDGLWVDMSCHTYESLPKSMVYFAWIRGTRRRFWYSRRMPYVRLALPSGDLVRVFVLQRDCATKGLWQHDDLA